MRVAKPGLFTCDTKPLQAPPHLGYPTSPCGIYRTKGKDVTTKLMMTAMLGVTKPSVLVQVPGLLQHSQNCGHFLTEKQCQLSQPLMVIDNTIPRNQFSPHLVTFNRLTSSANYWTKNKRHLPAAVPGPLSQLLSRDYSFCYPSPRYSHLDL